MCDHSLVGPEDTEKPPRVQLLHYKSPTTVSQGSHCQNHPRGPWESWEALRPSPPLCQRRVFTSDCSCPLQSPDAQSLGPHLLVAVHEEQTSLDFCLLLRKWFHSSWSWDNSLNKPDITSLFLFCLAPKKSREKRCPFSEKSPVVSHCSCPLPHLPQPCPVSPAASTPACALFHGQSQGAPPPPQTAQWRRHWPPAFLLPRLPRHLRCPSSARLAGYSLIYLLIRFLIVCLPHWNVSCGRAEPLVPLWFVLGGSLNIGSLM